MATDACTERFPNVCRSSVRMICAFVSSKDGIFMTIDLFVDEFPSKVTRKSELALICSFNDGACVESSEMVNKTLNTFKDVLVSTRQSSSMETFYMSVERLQSRKIKQNRFFCVFGVFFGHFRFLLSLEPCAALSSFRRSFEWP